jgi:hypothetical protein
MSFIKRLMGRGPSVEPAPSPARAEQNDEIFERAQAVRTLVSGTPTEWSESGSNPGVFEASKGVSAPGFGQLGFFSLSGSVTPEGGKYKCFVRAICMPLATDGRKDAESLAAAKTKVEEMMATHAVAIAMIILNMPR